MQPVATATTAASAGRCRNCAAPLARSFIDLGVSPLCQTHIEPDRLGTPEVFYPLHARICERCLLVQLDLEVDPRTLFADYAYFSSYSSTWVEHARQYVAAMVARLGLGARSRVFEVASNDGYLLQHVVARGIPCLGIEPAANIARAASARGIPTVSCFLGRDSARELVAAHGRADLVVANNVLAHVPDLDDFIGGLATLLAAHGTATLEFPHLLRLIEGNQFDTIYHEHFSYFSLLAAEDVFARRGLVATDVEELATHGGSLRLHVRHAGAATAAAASPRLQALRARERALGFDHVDAYAGFSDRVHETKRRLLAFLIRARDAGKRIAGYGAPGKGNTLLNYCGIGTDFLDYTVDRNPHKQGRFTPGMRIPICHPDRIFETRPDYVLILPWNLAPEICEQLAGIRQWGAQFVVPIPDARVL